MLEYLLVVTEDSGQSFEFPGEPVFKKSRSMKKLDRVSFFFGDG